MKKLLVIFCVLVFFCAVQVFSEEKTVPWEEHLALAKNHAIAQINWRKVEIQRLQDQIAVWEGQLKGIDDELLKIKQAEAAEGKPEKETKK